MKKPTPPPPSPPRRVFWPALAITSLALNLVFAVWTWRTTHQRPATLTPAASAAPSVATPTVASRSGELAPYAALGSYMAENNRLADLNWTQPQFAAFLEGLRASYEGRGLPLDDDAKHLRDQISQRVQAMLAAEKPNPVEDYFRALREKEGVSKTASGLHFRITETADGPKPKPGDTVVISFAAKLPDGTALPQLSRARARMVVHDLLPGLAEGVQLLSVGGKALVYLPPALAFSEDSWPPQIPHGVPLAFFVELHEIEPPSK